AKMAQGLANDLATACLLATSAPVLACPAMNPRMWAHPATRRNAAQLAADGVRCVGPAEGAMAERGETGVGRLSEPLEIVAAVEALFAAATAPRPLAGRRALVTSGPTHEPIDPVRYIANRSSGRQGHAIAAALAAAGAEVVLISGPVAIPDPPGVTVVRVETARQMLAAVEAALPADIAVMAAAVADWRVAAETDRKIKKDGGGAPALALTENPDILRTLGHHPNRPAFVVGFAAETNDVVQNGRVKLARKGADMIVANDVSPESRVMGGLRNTVHIVEETGVTHWPTLEKEVVAARLVALIAERLGARS
ncbi:MAG TPA: bifunctional phosphopantothenoylcysteine decarboxylase/phosphopantothenate--cysteine ligase CoaBC, partial [Methylomirabilota bacterium]|nr:bifunctional phosphopantothenoylcysteine decarboxylase/phosphopantothenate--cysteine ligase CoaBC [Methylomirabilota bacterium]